jgi:putative hydrolase of the HAD superfamily
MGDRVGEIRRERAPVATLQKVAPLRAVTFDFWNTVMAEPHGGLERARVDLWEALLEELGVPRARPDLVGAHAAAVAEQQSAWHDNEQYLTRDATATMLTVLRLDLTSSDASAFEAVFVTAAYSAGVGVCDGVADALLRFRDAGLRLAIICDIGLTPASGVRGLLRAEGLLDLFDITVFSDEQGTYKPDVRIFDHTLSALGVTPAAALHVGDRRRTDVEGALNTGMHAARYRAVFDDVDASYRDAPLVIDDHDELVELCAVR